ncbi:MAG: extracellular solute-binding protein [Firmicutes bacterium]|nr:extracellular solute-binding protein [Bacillota bacterium]
MKQTYRRFCAVLLILCLLCGCAAEKEVTVISLPGEEKMAVEEQNAPEATPTAVRGKTGEEAYHLELQKCVPENLSGITALTVLGDTIIAGGQTETGPSLVSFPIEGGETKTLDVPEGADYLYALCENPGGGFYLLSGTLPAGYLDERGNFTFLSGDPEGNLALARYDENFKRQETTPFEKQYTESSARFFQMIKTDGGFALVSASMLVWLDDSGAETARQELDPNDGWAFAAMQERDGILFVLTRDLFCGEAPELRAFDAKTLTPLEVQTLPLGTAGLGPGEDGTFLLTNSDGLSGYDLASGKVQTIASWRELGAQADAEQIFRTDGGYVLFSPNEAALTLVLWKAGAGSAKQVLTLAVAADCPVWYEFTQLFEYFNLSQQEYQIDYTIYSDSPYGDAEPMDVLRTKIMAGQSPDLFAFYSDGNQAPPLAPRAVCADLRELLPDVTEDSLLPGLFDVLTQDGALYVLPLTVRVDTLIMPSNLIDSPGVTLEDLETAREKIPGDWVPVDSWNTPGNLFGLTAAFCIGRFVDRETGTCRFETQEFIDILDWCKNWGGDGSTPEAPEKTLMKLGWISSLSWLASREDIAKEWFDGAGYTYAGYPVGEGGSAYLVLTSLGVSTSCQNLAGAKAFLAYCFSGKQESGLPANMEVLREELAQYKAGNRTDWYGEVENISEADEAKFLELLSSVTVLEGMDQALENILSEEADAYFAGAATAQQAAKIIQSRASLYLQEQYPGA